MFWFITICISHIIYANGFVIQDTFNVLMNDDADYKVDLIITDDDYEMIDKKELKEFKIENEKEKFRKLTDMARVAYYRGSTLITKFVKQPSEGILPMIVVSSQSTNTATVMTTYVGPTGNIIQSLYSVYSDVSVASMTACGKYAQNQAVSFFMYGTNSTHVDMLVYSVYQKWLQSTTISANDNIFIKVEIETEYDYDKLVNEYYDEANNDSRSKNAYHIRKSVIDIKDYGVIISLKKIFTLTSGIDNCSEVNGIGLLAVKCLLNDYNSQRLPMRDLIVRLWRIFQIWFLVYLSVAIPLWCTRGWCCCCLCCKFFKPRQTIEEAKKYVIAYPPGVFKNKNGEIRYEPSEREKQCYEEFEHFIKTL